MANNQSNNPQHGGKSSKPPPRRVETDERTIELTEDEIKSFGKGNAPAVRAGNKGPTGGPSKSR